MKFRTAKLLRRRKIARKKIQTTEKLIQVLVISLMLTLVFLVGCENIRHSIGITGKPLSTDMEQNLKMNYKIIFGKVRNKNEEDD